MKITIQTTENGYILTDSEGDMHTIEERLTRDDVERFKTEDERKLAFSRLVEMLAEELGFFYDKFDEGNMRVVWAVKGHKVEEGV